MAPKVSMSSILAILSLLVAGASAQSIPSYYDKLVKAHGIVGPITFVFLIPLGGLVIRCLDFNGVVYLHAGIQMLAFAGACFMFGTGIWFGTVYDFYLAQHMVIGYILFGFVFVQPFLGTIHHQVFKRKARRTFLSIVHVNIGRLVIPLGVLNAGLGLKYAGDADLAEYEGYAITAGFIWLFYLLTVCWMEHKNVKYQKWLMDTDGAQTKLEMGVEARKLGVYEDSAKS